MSSLIDKLKEKEHERNKEYDTIFWKPEEGEIIEGVVEDIGSTITEFGDANYIQLSTSDGKKVMVFTNSILDKQIDSEEVKKGDRIAIKFLGYVSSSKHKNRKFKDYILVKESESV